MNSSVARLLQHYSTVTNGESTLLREDLLEFCEHHGVSEEIFSDAFAVAIAESFVSGRLEASRASFAIDDLFWASGCALTGFAKAAWDAFEYGEATTDEVRALLLQRQHPIE